MTEIFLKLINMSITASWIVLAVILLRLVLKKAPKGITCALWALVAIRLLCPLSMESVLSLIPSAETVPEEIVYAREPVINSGVPFINQAVNPIITDTFAPPDTLTSINPIQIFLAVAANIWILGMIAMVLYAGISYLRLRRKIHEAVETEKGVWICDPVSTPFILGIFRPRIILPSAMVEQDREYVLAHERAHLRRRDHLWKPLGYALLTVYWFNPLLWVAYILLCRDIELACDERVIREMGTEEKKAYTTALLNCSMPRRMIAACPLAFGEVGVKTRIKSVLHYKKPAFWLIAAAIVALVGVAIGFLTNPKERKTEPPDISAITAHAYGVEKVVYGAPYLSIMYFPDHDTPYFSVTEDMDLLCKERINTNQEWTRLGKLEDFILTKANFDDLFFAEGFFRDGTPSELRRENVYAWRLAQEDPYYLLQQENGDLYIAYGTREMHWMFKLRQDLHADTGAIAVSGRHTVPLILPSGKTLAEVKELVYWLDITENEDAFTPFDLYCDNRILRGRFSIYDAETMEPLAFFTPSGLEPQTYIFQNAVADGSYIITVQTNENDVWYFGARLSGDFMNNLSSTAISVPNETTVAHAGYISNYAIITGALNRDKMMESSIQHLPIYKFESVAELEQFESDFAEDIATRAHGEVPCLDVVAKQYDAEFFEEKALLIVYVESSSGSCRYDVGSVVRSAESKSLVVHAELTRSPETADMAGWFLCVAMNKDTVQNCTTFDADLNAISHADKLIGKWSAPATNMGILDEDTPKYSEWSYIFFADGKGLHTVDENVSEFTYTTKGRLLQMRFARASGMEDVKTFVYTVNGDTLTLTDELAAYRSATLTKTEMDADAVYTAQPLPAKLFEGQDLPAEPKTVDRFAYYFDLGDKYPMERWQNVAYLDNGMLQVTENGDFVFSFSIYQDALPYVEPLYTLLDSIVTVDYEGNRFDTLSLANEHITITLNEQTTTVSEVRLGAGNGHRDFYVTFATDVMLDLREIRSFSIEVE